MALTTAAVLEHPSSEKDFFVSTDASKYTVGATLEQDFHPVAFLAHRLSDEESNWDTSDQELLAFMIALREWSTYLPGRKFKLLTDHEPIHFLQTKSKIFSRQFRWLDVLQEHTFEVQHIPGSKHTVLDALSRRADHFRAVELKRLCLRDPTFPNRIRKGYDGDVWEKKLLASLRDSEEPEDQKVSIQISNYAYGEGFLFWIGNGDRKVYVPDSDGPGSGNY